MSYITVNVQVDADEVLEEMSDETLNQEFHRRQSGSSGPGGALALQLIYEEFRRRGDAPKLLRDYIYENIGRIL